MKQKLIIAFVVIFTVKSFSQDSKFSLELNYPIPVDDNFIGKNYNGIVDLGLKYRFANLSVLNIGAAINAGILKNSKDDSIQPFDVTAFAIQPRIFAELNVESLTRFHPTIGLGYTFITFKASGIDSFNPDNPNASSASQTENGININVGIAYDITNRWFAQVQYNFIKINVDNEVPDTTYNTNISIIKIGVGYRF